MIFKHGADSPIRVILRGGFGNQLHIFLASFVIAHELKKNLILDGRFLSWSGSNSTRSLELDKFEWEIPEYIKVSYRKSFPSLGKHLVVRKVILKIADLLSSNRSKSFLTESLNDLPSICKYVEEYRQINGEFINYDWVFEAFNRGFSTRLNLRYRCISDLEITDKTCAVHIRMTDFLDHPNIFPKLSESYYLKSISEMKARNADRFLLFTDDVNQLESAYPKILELDGVIVVPVTVNTTESFFLMQSCNFVITSNSTFSALAASFIWRNQGQVICPDIVTYHNKIDTRPKGWTRLDHQTGDFATTNY